MPTALHLVPCSHPLFLQHPLPFGPMFGSRAVPTLVVSAGRQQAPPLCLHPTAKTTQCCHAVHLSNAISALLAHSLHTVMVPPALAKAPFGLQPVISTLSLPVMHHQASPILYLNQSHSHTGAALDQFQASQCLLLAAVLWVMVTHPGSPFPMVCTCTTGPF